jgi:hypothetical protein
VGAHERHLGVGGSASQLEFDVGIEDGSALLAAAMETPDLPAGIPRGATR